MKKLLYSFIGLLISILALQAQTGLHFVGSDLNYVDLPYIENTFNNHDFTVEAWIYPESTSHEVIFAMGESNADDKGFELKIYNGYITAWHWYDNWNSIYPVSTGEWYHIAYCYLAASKTAYLYVNGDSITSHVFSGYLDVNSGEMYSNIGFSGFADRYYDGIIDELRVWNDIRSTSEIVNNMGETISLGDTNLIAYYQFEDGEICGDNTNDTILSDLTGNYHGILRNFDLEQGCTSNYVKGYIDSLFTIYGTISDMCVVDTIYLYSKWDTMTSYLWQKNNGEIWENVTDDDIFSGSDNDTLTILYPTEDMYDANFRLIYTYDTIVDTSNVIKLPIDWMDPEITVMDTTSLYLNEYGEATLLVSDIVTYAYDNCSISDTLISQSVFDCLNKGDTIDVIVTLTDSIGNAGTDTIKVAVYDTIEPEIKEKEITLLIDENGEAILSDVVTDNCDVADQTYSQSSFDCSDVGKSIEVFVEYLNESKDTVYDTIVVTIDDNIAPVVNCLGDQTKTVSGDSYSVSGDEFDPTITEGCDYTLINDYNNSETLSSAEFPLGTTNVKWKATDTFGNSDSCSFAVTVTVTNGINDIALDDFNVYPNPSNGIFYFQVQDIRNVEICDLTGKKLMAEKNNNGINKVDLSEFENGVYILTIKTDTKMYVKKLIKR